MTTTAQKISEKIEKYKVLTHPFYQAWNEGKLTKETLQTYARQYFQHVDAFPRYISATHSQCRDLKARQYLLENLNDEERGDKNHPELWMRFAEGLGAKRDEVTNEAALPYTNELVETFMGLARSSFEEGLGALYAYESQVPEVAEAKIKGLEEFYGINDVRTLEFFEVHRLADIYHSKAVKEIIDGLSEEQKVMVARGASKASKALWNFLGGIMEACPENFEGMECDKEALVA